MISKQNNNKIINTQCIGSSNQEGNNDYYNKNVTKN